MSGQGKGQVPYSKPSFSEENANQLNFVELNVDFFSN